MTVDPTLLLSATRSRELQAEARRDALVRLATCCRPSAWHRVGSVALARLRAVRAPGSATTCCA